MRNETNTNFNDYYYYYSVRKTLQLKKNSSVNNTITLRLILIKHECYNNAIEDCAQLYSLSIHYDYIYFIPSLSIQCAYEKFLSSLQLHHSLPLIV